MKKQIIFALLVISVFLVSACDIYQKLYANQSQQGAIKISDENISKEVNGGIKKTESENKSDKKAEKISQDAVVIIVEETELVNLVPKAEDPDKDVLDFTFTSPLNENGEWKTTYGDAGEYTVTITASDGSLTTTKEVLIIVNRKEEAPTIDSFAPEEIALSINETQTVKLSISASDLNKDELKYTWKLDGVPIGNKDSAEYQTTYEDAGSHTLKVAVSDGMFDAEKIWSVTVNNVNRKPVLKEIEDINVKETSSIVIELEASDHDGDKIEYEIDDKRFVQDGNKFTWKTGYDDAGDYLVTASVSDGTDKTTQQFKVKVENVNRAPVILDIIQKK
ncbi:hypothetical protein HYX01_00780 [Candidatus Woesearchaeota archaeon]|nr:hypothetical protein [Candidatus Woesearchaeota archaeon]